MRLGFHYHISAYKKGDKIITMSLQGLFIDSLAPHFENVILFLHSPGSKDNSVLDYEIVAKNVELVDIGPHSSVPARLLKSGFSRRQIKKRLNDLDILLLRAPTPLLPLITKDVRKKIKYVYLVVGEMVEHADNIPQPGWRKALIKQFLIWNERLQKKYAGETLVLFNSAAIMEKYSGKTSQSSLIRTTTLKKSDFFIREDSCLVSPYQLLFTGRIERAKGLLEIVEAMGILAKENIETVLNIVGWAAPNDPTPRLIKEYATKAGLADKIIFHGKKKVGEELFGFYRRADIFVIASQVAEGFPRTITEALANSLPVISTSVGSIPLFHKHAYDIMLVEPRNARDIADNIKELVNNSQLRKNLIKNGIKTVEDVTLEVQAEKITEILKGYIAN